MYADLRACSNIELDDLRLEREGLLADIDAMSMDVVADDPRLLDRAEIGALQIRKQAAVNNLSSNSTNLQASRSLI